MSKKKESGSGRHRFPGFMLRLHSSLRAQLERLAERNATKLTHEITIAIRERLERTGFWPPPAS